MSVNFFTDDSDKTSCPSDVFDDAYEVSVKTKTSQSAKKKKPKRNRSAFIIFSSEMRTKLRSDDREKLNSNEMMVKLAELWKNLPEMEKKKFYNQAEKEKERYHSELNHFYQNFPAEVIQNKTKKNHIKKPCSAYALYLKEKKQEIKNEKPDLKMADILKVVAERWKNLDDDERIIYQRMAQNEKELARAKLNEVLHLQIEEPVPQKKSTQSKKKVASPKKTHKLDQEVKVEEKDTKIEPDTQAEEPPLLKKHPHPFNFSIGPNNMGLSHFNIPFFFPPPTQPVMSHNNSNVTENTYKQDFIVPEFSYLSNPFSKLPSAEPVFMSKYSSKDEGRFGKENSQVWNYPPESFFAKMPSDRLDLMNFQSFKLDNVQEFIKKEEEFTDSDDEYLPSTATELTPNSSIPATRTTMNNVLISALEPQSDFDPLSLDAGFDNFILLK